MRDWGIRFLVFRVVRLATRPSFRGVELARVAKRPSRLATGRNSATCPKPEKKEKNSGPRLVSFSILASDRKGNLPFPSGDDSGSDQKRTHPDRDGLRLSDDRVELSTFRV